MLCWEALDEVKAQLIYSVKFSCCVHFSIPKCSKVRSSHPFLVAQIWLCFKWIMYEMFRKGKYKNKDKVSKLTPLRLSFFALAFQNCCVLCWRIINERGRGTFFFRESTIKAMRKRPKKLRKMLYLSFLFSVHYRVGFKKKVSWEN